MKDKHIVVSQIFYQMKAKSLQFPEPKDHYCTFAQFANEIFSNLSSKALASREGLHDSVQLKVDHCHRVREGPALNEKPATSGVDLRKCFFFHS